jgi:phage FluMu protein Com
MYFYNQNIRMQRLQQNEITVNEKRILNEKKCFNCNSLLVKAKIDSGIVEIKCRRCGCFNYIKGDNK